MDRDVLKRLLEQVHEDLKKLTDDEFKQELARSTGDIYQIVKDSAIFQTHE